MYATAAGLQVRTSAAIPALAKNAVPSIATALASGAVLPNADGPVDGAVLANSGVVTSLCQASLPGCSL